MGENSNKRGVIVGLFVFAGLVFLVAGTLMVGNLHDTFKKKIQLQALFEDVGGLQKGDNIWFSGVKIGVVSSLRFLGVSKVEVTLKIETNVQQYIRKDAKVKLSTDGLIGNKILIIYGGTAVVDEVQEGDILTVEKTLSTEDMLNTLQKNNENVLAITTDFKAISKKLTTSEGTLGKLLNENDLYDNINATSLSLKSASSKAQQLVASLNDYSAGLHKEGTLANQLVTDTFVFNTAKSAVLQLQHIADTAALFISDLKVAGNNPNTTIGVLLHDEKSGDYLKATIKNLERSSGKLDEDLEALQHNFLLRRYFKKKDKAAKLENK